MNYPVLSYEEHQFHTFKEDDLYRKQILKKNIG